MLSTLRQGGGLEVEEDHDDEVEEEDPSNVVDFINKIGESSAKKTRTTKNHFQRFLKFAKLDHVHAEYSDDIPLVFFAPKLFNDFASWMVTVRKLKKANTTMGYLSEMVMIVVRKTWSWFHR